MQIFPGGKCVQTKGDLHGPEFRVMYEREKRWRKAKPDELRAIKIQTLAEMYADRDIFRNECALISDLMRHFGDGGRGDLKEAFNWEQVTNLRPDPDDWDIAECKKWLEDQGHDLPHPNPWAMDREALLEFIDCEDEDLKREHDDKSLLTNAIEGIDDLRIDGIEAWREAVRENAEDAEIYEWYSVSGWLASKLKDIGECVLDNGYGTWWGRTCTGQALIMDGTLQEIAAEFA